MILVTQSQNRAPLPENRECKPLDVRLNWLMKHIDTEAMASIFRVDTQSPETKTPRRNPQVEDALSFMSDLSSWTRSVREYFIKGVQQDVVDKHNPAGSVPRSNPEESLTRLSDDTFVPVQPLFEEGATKGSTAVDLDSTPSSKSIISLPSQVGANGSSVLLTAEDMHKFLTEQVRTTNSRLDVLGKMYPASNKSGTVISVAEASLVQIALHCERVVNSYIRGVGYVEQMLYDQLVSAIGKRIEGSDIDQFLRYHNARLLRPPPAPFCHAIRQPKHYPCGILSIEAVQNGGKRYPIETLVRKVDSGPSIKLPLNAATTIELTGTIFLHGWIQHRFGPSRNVPPELIARARQFSSFLLVVGTMSGSDKLEPKDAVIIQNKDELIIPLILDEIPTAKEFKNAIRSLSPEQQRFAQAFRTMKLGSSVLGISVIQIKPQLEALLGLPSGALTKEMKLTQDLMELFVEYQVPSDLLSYDGNDSSSSPKEKVDTVRAHVQAVSGVIHEAKTKELNEQSMKAEMAFRSAVTDSPLACLKRKSSEQRRAEEMASSLGWFRNNESLGSGSLASNDGGDSLDDIGDFKPISVAEYVPNTNEQLTASQMNKPGPANFTALEQPKLLAPYSTICAPATVGAIDFAAVPRILDVAIEQYAQGAALRSTVITLGDGWIRNRQESLLAKATASVLQADDLKRERNQAMDLLDALSRSGSLPIHFSELHVIVCVTHCFEKDVIETIIQDNINPIEKLENSTLVVGSAIYGVPVAALIGNPEDPLQRLKEGGRSVVLPDALGTFTAY
jgi:hypothetical protein